MKLKIFLTLTILIAVSFIFTAAAQCPMCKASVESSLADGTSKAGLGLNTGILYLLAMPYILCSVVGYIWWKKYRNKSEIELDSNKINLN